VAKERKYRKHQKSLINKHQTKNVFLGLVPPNERVVFQDLFSGVFSHLGIEKKHGEQKNSSVRRNLFSHPPLKLIPSSSRFAV